MRITALVARDLLSYQAVDLDLEPRLTVVTGPNGSGKSNLGRVMDLVRMGVQACATSSWTKLTSEYTLAGRFGSDAFEARLGIHFDSPNDLDLIEDWARSALLTALAAPSADNVESYESLLPDNVNGVALFGKGTIVVRRDPRLRHPWVVFWEFSAAGRVWQLPLWGDNRVTEASRAGSTSQSGDLIEWLRRRGDVLAAPALAEPDQRSTFQLEEALDVGGLELVVRSTGRQAEPDALLRTFARLGLSLGSGTSIAGFAMVLDRLMTDGIRITSNRRSAMRTYVETSDLLALSNLEDGSGTALELLRLKNGDASDRVRFVATQSAFHELTGAILDVRQQALESTDGGSQLLVVPVVVNKDPGQRNIDLPLALSGAGIEEAAFLALLLTDPVPVLILDEPGANVSAVAQRRLVLALRQHRRDFQTIVITHSSHLIPAREPGDLAGVVRMTQEDDRGSVVHRPGADPALFAKLKQLLRSSDIRDLLFSAGVLLLEGGTELEAFETWLAEADAHGLPTPESAHVVLLPVGGHQNFGNYARLLDELGVRYAVLADGPAFRAGGPLDAMPRKPPPPGDLASETFNEAREHWTSFGVRTLADDFHDDGSKGGEIEAYFERLAPQVWAEVRGKNKIRKGAEFATRVPLPAEVLTVWRESLADLGLAVDG